LSALIVLSSVCSEPSYDAEFDHLLRGGEAWSSVEHQRSTASVDKAVNELKQMLSTEQRERLSRLMCALPVFAKAADVLKSGGADTQAWLQSDTPETNVPILYTQPAKGAMSKWCVRAYTRVHL
jgi:hypothetical protein